ncbi:anillin isoform X2 [Octopus sinensis]|uniref:Anillin isoform X2 n=1 Tax=Octopus sinensis TaxID=2607531 RepID=A0A6P7SWK8_9MOLL|nr:anillin isoform X2 [Octopus sinensis]
MDEETRKIIERTKERRERLKMMSETDGIYSRRRPLSEDMSANIETVQDDDSPKRQCLRSAEQNIKPDTPAIRGVQSRRNDLTTLCLSSDDGDYVPVPVPRKSLCQEENRDPNEEVFKPQCRSRLAKLAQRINAWDDDYSKHETVGRPNSVHLVDRERDIPMTTEGQLETRNSRSRTAAPVAPHMRSPRSKSAAPMASAPATPLPVRSKSPGPSYTPRSPAPVAPRLIPGDDLESAIETMSRQQKPLRNNKKNPYTAKGSGQDHLQDIPSEIPVNARGLNDSFTQGETTDDEPTNKPVSERLAKWSKKVSATETNCVSPASPSKSENTQPNSKTITPMGNRCSQNLSSKVAQLEKSLGISSTPKQNRSAFSNQQSSQSSGSSSVQINSVSSSVPSSATHNTPAAEPVNMRNKEGNKRRESFEPTSQSVSKRMAEWQKKVNTLEAVTEKEPTAYPVNARMSAWEQVTASGSTESNKMIKPKGTTLPCPTTTPSRPVSANIPKSPGMSRKFESPVVRSNSIESKSKPLSPSKASCAMKAIQQRLFETQQSTTTHSMAEKIRQERMAELKVLENRWHNGILKDNTVKSNQESDIGEPSATVPNENKTGQMVATSGIPPPPPPPLPGQSKTTASATSSTITASAGENNSIFKLVAAPQNSAVPEKKSALVNPGDTPLKSVVKQVHFEDSFESSDDYYGYGNYQESSIDDISDETDAERTLESHRDLQYMEQDFEEDYYSSSEENEALCRAAAAHNSMSHPDNDESDDVSISAFVPESVRQQYKLSLQTESSTNIIELGKRQQHLEKNKNRKYQPHDNIDSTDDTLDEDYDSDEMESMGTTSVDDLIDDALDSDTDDNRPQTTPIQSANKRGSHLLATCTDSCYDDTTTDDDVVMRKRSPLMYSISMYRSKRFSNNTTPVQKIVRNSRPMSSEEELERETPKEDSRKSILERIKQLSNQVSLEQTVILQTSNALNQCCTEGSNFSGSAQQVECHKLLLIACQKRRAYLEEIQRLKTSNCLNPFGPGTKGTLAISDIRLPLKKDFVSRLSTVYDLNVFYYVILLRNGPQVFTTQLMSTHDPMVRGSLDFPNMIKMTDITSKFQVTLELYEMKLSKDRSCKKKKSKKCKAPPILPVSSNPAGPTSIHSSSFTLTWSTTLKMSNIDKNSFTMDRVPYDAPLIGSIYLRMKCNMETNVSESGFLTMFEDVSGLGAWHRRWCVLSGNKMKYWKYPDDENRKDPIGYIDLKRCITEKVGLISRDICARPNTFEMCTVRPLRAGEEDTLVTRKHHTMATIRHMLSADTKEERILWCNKLNEALENIRAWQVDALKPIKVPSHAV